MTTKVNRALLAPLNTVVTAVSVTAAPYDAIHMTAATQTVTLPANPAPGDSLSITV